MAKSHKTCTEQAKIIDTFGTYQLQIPFMTSNNVAEYEALVHGIKLAKEIGIRNIICFGDSDLVVQKCT